jgi:methyltransferase family protein
MKWIAHQIRLPDSSSTMGHQEGHSERVLRHIQLVADVLSKPLSQVRTLDLACLEGGFTFELAMQGAEAIGLEGRKENVDKCEAVRAKIGLSNCSFLEDDVRNLSKHKHGSFDVVLCLGILYHLAASDGVELLGRIYDVCQRAVIIDTHVALFGEEQVTIGAEVFSGRSYCEFPSNTPPERKQRALASSLDNDSSFWMTEESLCRCLKAVGFSSIMKVVIPPIPLNVNDRVTLVALKGNPVQLLSCDVPTKHELPERTNPSILRASFTDKELTSVYSRTSAPSEAEGIEVLVARAASAELKAKQLQNQLQTANAVLDSVLKSRGWKILTWYRKVRDRLRSISGRS